VFVRFFRVFRVQRVFITELLGEPGAYFFYWTGKKAGLKAAPAAVAAPASIPENADDEKPAE